MEIVLKVSKSEVLHEVAQTTEYTGSKMDDDANAYERISTVDEDNSELQCFWDESRAEIAKMFMKILSQELMYTNDEFRLGLQVSGAFDTNLVPSMQLGLFAFFVQNITAKWFVFTNKKEATDYADRASALLSDIKEKALYKKRPIRPTYDD